MAVVLGPVYLDSVWLALIWKWCLLWQRFWISECFTCRGEVTGSSVPNLPERFRSGRSAFSLTPTAPRRSRSSSRQLQAQGNRTVVSQSQFSLKSQLHTNNLLHIHTEALVHTHPSGLNSTLPLQEETAALPWHFPEGGRCRRLVVWLQLGEGFIRNKPWMNAQRLHCRDGRVISLEALQTQPDQKASTLGRPGICQRVPPAPALHYLDFDGFPKRRRWRCHGRPVLRAHLPVVQLCK